MHCTKNECVGQWSIEIELLWLRKSPTYIKTPNPSPKTNTNIWALCYAISNYISRMKCLPQTFEQFAMWFQIIYLFFFLI